MDIDEQHECDRCHKTYRRKDLLSRHRRHCDPNKHVSKRKSCNACVQARSKCDLSQPCSRCAKRALICEYATINQESPNHSSSLQFQSNAGGSTYSRSSTASDSASNPAHTPQSNDWATMDFSMPQGAYFDSVTFDQTALSQPTPSSISMPQWEHHSISSPKAAFPLTNSTVSNLAPQATAIVRRDSHVHLHGLDLNTSTLIHESPLEADKLLTLLRQYPTSFESDDYHTPLLHRELYGLHSLGITSLPKSTTAISCAMGLRCRSNSSFLKQAISAERQRLVEGFVSHPRCISTSYTLTSVTAEIYMPRRVGRSACNVAL